MLSVIRRAVYVTFVAAMLTLGPPAGATEAPAGQSAEARKTRVTGVVRDAQNTLALPGATVSVKGSRDETQTDVDGRYVLDLLPGSHELVVSIEGYQERTIRVEVGTRPVTADVALAMTRFAEEITVRGQAGEALSATQEGQLIERKHAQVITDNIGAVEMKSNGDSDAASAVSRLIGVSVVDGQFVFVRGLGERYSNTTLGGSVVPTTEPDKKVVPLDLFPTALLDSVQIAKSYTPDRSADFAGGLVEIVPQKLPNRQMLDGTFKFGWSETATGRTIPISPLGSRDRWGFDGGARAMPAGFPSDKIVRQGIFTPEVGYLPAQITEFGRMLENRWLPENRSGRPGQGFDVSYGNRWNKLGVIASVSQGYKEQYVEESRRFYRLESDGDLEAVSDYDLKSGSQKAQLGVVANVAWQFNPANRLALENFYTHSGRDEGRFFEGPNTENNFIYRNYRLQFVEEGLLTHRVTGEHFLPSWGNSRIDWRVSHGRASRDEPDLRETLYQAPLTGGTFLLADESQSGFRLFNTLDDDTMEVATNWTLLQTLGGRPAVYKFGPSYVKRTRDFSSRRFRYIPTNLNTPNLSLPPEQIFTTNNIGTSFRFNEETRPVDAYDGEQTTASVYAMADLVLSDRSRLIGGVRVERFEQQVNTFDPFGLFEQQVEARLNDTDVFPGVNFVYSMTRDVNLRLGYSQTVNRPEFRELAAFEFTDVVGNRAVRGNPALTRALIRNLDARLEAFTGGRGVLAASVFVKQFDDPIERVISAGAQPLQTYQNADSARNIGVELEAGRELTRFLYVSANYAYVDSEIRLNEEARRVQTSLTRPLAGQSKNLFNAIAEVSMRSFQGRVLYNFFDDRVSDVGANGAPDIVEQGRGTLDVVLLQRFGRLGARLTLENLTDKPSLYTQGPAEQRRYSLGRTVLFSLGYSFF